MSILLLLEMIRLKLTFDIFMNSFLTLTWKELIKLKISKGTDKIFIFLVNSI